MYSRPQDSELPELDDELIRLLADVGRADSYYYESSSPQSSQYQQLCSLESLGYIRYCSYPEEFWVILPAGKEFLSTLSQRQRRLRDEVRFSAADAENHEPAD
jgi:hypothetical protein